MAGVLSRVSAVLLLEKHGVAFDDKCVWVGCNPCVVVAVAGLNPELIVPVETGLSGWILVGDAQNGQNADIGGLHV